MIFQDFFSKNSVVDLGVILPRILSLTVAHSRCTGIWLRTASMQFLAYPPASSHARFRDFLLSFCFKGHFHWLSTQWIHSRLYASEHGGCIYVGRNLVRLLLSIRNSLQPKVMVRQAAGPVGFVMQLPGIGFLNPGPRVLNFVLASFCKTTTYWL